MYFVLPTFRPWFPLDVSWVIHRVMIVARVSNGHDGPGLDWGKWLRHRIMITPSPSSVHLVHLPDWLLCCVTCVSGLSLAAGRNICFRLGLGGKEFWMYLLSNLAAECLRAGGGRLNITYDYVLLNGFGLEKTLKVWRGCRASPQCTWGHSPTPKVSSIFWIIH